MTTIGGYSVSEIEENARRVRIEALEHEALEPRSSDAWGHLPRCHTCVLLRVAEGTTTAQDRRLSDAQGRPLVTT